MVAGRQRGHCRGRRDVPDRDAGQPGCVIVGERDDVRGGWRHEGHGERARSQSLIHSISLAGAQVQHLYEFGCAKFGMTSFNGTCFGCW